MQPDFGIWMARMRSTKTSSMTVADRNGQAPLIREKNACSEQGPYGSPADMHSFGASGFSSLVLDIHFQVF